MHKTGPGKKSGLEMIIRVWIIYGVICALPAQSCFAAENGRVEIVVDGQRVVLDMETVEENAVASDERERQNAESVSEDISMQEEMKADDTLMTLLEEVKAALPTENGEWSVYICDLIGDYEGCIKEQSMQAASLIKLYIMGAVYERYDELTEIYGKENVDANLKSMITVSDNEAANTLTGYLGNGDFEKGMCEVSEYCLKKGFTCTSMGRLLLQSGTAGENYTSVRDCGRFLKAVYGKDTETFPHAEEMFELLSEQTRRNKIPAQLPDGVLVANKTGELADVENDAGIIYDTAHDLVLVFMSQELTDAAAAQQTIAKISRQIYDFYVSN